MDKEKSDLQYKLDSEQKGIHARRDSDVCSIVILSRLTYILFVYVTTLNNDNTDSLSFCRFMKSKRGEFVFILSVGSVLRLIDQRQ